MKKKSKYVVLTALCFICACSPHNRPQQTKNSNSVIEGQHLKNPISLSESESENLDVLNYHNKTRATLNLNPLIWSNKIAQSAQRSAKNLADKGCKLQHNSRFDYGENLFMGTRGHYTLVDAAKLWESEKRHYSGDFLNSANWQKVGHYTQMVWRDTTKLGCAKAVCNNNEVIVCHYYPAGNYMGQKPY